MKKHLSLKILSIAFGFLILVSCSNSDLDKAEEANGSLFTLLYPTKTNINFQNSLTEGLNTNILMYEYFYNGAGVAAGDFNGDDLDDLYFTANLTENKLYLNNGDFNFQDITKISGAGGRPGPWKTGVSVVDINADGKLDIYLCYSGTLPAHKRVNQLFVNQGNTEAGVPQFKDEAAKYGLDSPGFSNQAYFFDADLDGDLDVLLLNHNPKNLPILNEASTAEFMKTDDPEKGLRFYQNDNGYYTDKTTSSGINGSALSYGLGLGISDFNDDGWPDFYVSNDYSVPDYIYINQRNGKFKNEIDESIGHTSQFSMGNDVADINNDGQVDIFTLDMLPEDNRRQKLLLAPDNFNKFDLNVRSGFHYQYMRNMLQLNNGNGTFSEIGQLSGVSNTDWSWSALLADYDNDGWKDLFVSNGYFRDFTNLDFIKYMDDFVKEKGRLQRDDVLEIISHMPSSNVGNYIFKNQNGGGFQNKTKDWGLGEASNSNGATYADLDNDGDLDLVVNNINKAAFVFRNDSENNYLKIKLEGSDKNPLGIGAKLTFESGDEVMTLEQNLGRGYLSSVSPVLNLGLGKKQSIGKLTIKWPTGKVQILTDVKANQTLILNVQDAIDDSKSLRSNITLFEEVKSPIPYQHKKTKYRDFDRQPLLIHEQSFTGPCMLKGDLNKDGLEDVFIGGALGENAVVFLQNGGGGFKKNILPNPANGKKGEDIDVAFLDINSDGFLDILVAAGGYHQLKADDESLADRFYLNDGSGKFGLSNNVTFKNNSTSCLAVNDINGDGLDDVFVGGGVLPGRYPEHIKSHFLINNGKGGFKEIKEALFDDLGLVKTAKWVDLDADGSQELVLAGEWMSIKIFKNQKGKLTDVSELFLDRAYLGWWNTLEVKDLNGDGKPDLILGNEGLNTQFQATGKEPLELYSKDFDNNGIVDPLFCFYIQGKSYPYITRDELLSQLPKFRPEFTTYQSFSEVGLDKLFPASELKTADYFKADYMSTTLLLSQPDNKYKVAELPREAQYTPVFSINIEDFDKDGKEDILLLGNNTHSKLRLGKSDANYGLLLKGDGKGGFETVSQSASGLKIRGDVRSSTYLNEILYVGLNGEGLKSFTLKN
ncbi:VCBS repeat-containing protein [Arcticibacterium luteifluviistationis]|uniref:RNA-binding protein n=1 Tax=Arcticibacterium luteifluviistationis TaxID=1784714 RepID=A0A2Z4GAR9_9BACT|nr:VCBS repeat-containing protein [Arcticibacterium luteifluviistationis]AWV98316.1 RNA-binding protein [Arcticibacterium luteifluviistationis]